MLNASNTQHDADEKDELYQQLQAAVETIPSYDNMLLIFGDLNTRTGPGNRGKERYMYMGKHGMREFITKGY